MSRQIAIFAGLSRTFERLSTWAAHRLADLEIVGSKPITCVVGESKRGTSQSEALLFIWIGSPGRTRTCDQPVNSRLLYQLSYRGTGQVIFGLRILAKDVAWGENFFISGQFSPVCDQSVIHRNLVFHLHQRSRLYYLPQRMHSAWPRSDRDYHYRASYRLP